MATQEETREAAIRRAALLKDRDELVSALKAERLGYAQRGNAEGVKAVDAQLKIYEDLDKGKSDDEIQEAAAKAAAAKAAAAQKAAEEAAAAQAAAEAEAERAAAEETAAQEAARAAADKAAEEKASATAAAKTTRSTRAKTALADKE